MNILIRQEIWNTLKLHIPMLICAAWVITLQRKLIWDTLKRGGNGGLRNGPKERINYMIMGVAGAVCFIFALSTLGIKKNLVEKQKHEVEKQVLEEKVATREELEAQIKKVREKEILERKAGKKTPPSSLPLGGASPILSFVLVCIIAPLGEECVFRYLIFEIFDKKKPFAYIFSGIGFILLHWLGPLSGLFNFTTLQILLLTYLPITILFIYTYRKSGGNITYPIYFHFLWNLVVFGLTVSQAYK